MAVGFTDAADEYKSGAVSATRLAGYSERKSDLDTSGKSLKGAFF